MRKWFFRKGDSLVPCDDAGIKSVRRLELGESIELEMKRSRSPQWNRLYWGCCREIGLNQEPLRDEESISDEIKVLAGHYTKLIADGFEVRVPKRINFRAMTPEQWEEYWVKADQVMLQKFGFDSASFERTR